MTDDSKILLDQLSSEYKILQDKLDKIGAFRFTIKGWSVTLVIASVFAVGANRQVPPVLLLFLLLFIWLFFLVEHKQNRLGFIFGQRLFELERHIRRVLRANVTATGKKVAYVGFTPRIAHHVHDAARSSGRTGKANRLVSWAFDPDHLFYLIQTAAIIGAFLIIAYRSSKPAESQQSIIIIENERAISSSAR